LGLLFLLSTNIHLRGRHVRGIAAYNGLRLLLWRWLLLLLLLVSVAEVII
jgi:hypothetical protein